MRDREWDEALNDEAIFPAPDGESGYRNRKLKALELSRLGSLRRACRLASGLAATEPEEVARATAILQEHIRVQALVDQPRPQAQESGGRRRSRSRSRRRRQDRPEDQDAVNARAILSQSIGE